MDDLNDAELVAKARSGDADAFSVLASRYRALALSVALRLAGQRDAAEDLVQEATIAAFVSLPRLRDPDRFRSWFYGTVVNVSRAWRRRQAGCLVSLDDCAAAHLLADPVDEVAARELRWIVTDALRCLPEPTRVALVLFYYDGLSVLEIAGLLGISTAAAKSRLHNGRRRLGRLLAAEYPELTRAAARGERTSDAMIELHITSVVSFPARVLVVLAGEPGARVLPAWLTPSEGLPLVRPAGSEPAPPRSARQPSPELAVNILAAAGGSIRAVRIGELADGPLFGAVVITGPDGDTEVPAGLGDALELSRLTGCPILASEDLLARHGVPIPAGESAADVLIRRAGLSQHAQGDGHDRPAAPQNLSFGAELAHWALRGSFLRDASGGHWQDYDCGVDPDGPAPAPVSGYLRSLVPEPTGFADLRQGILADDYRGRRVRLSADIKTAGVDAGGGLYLRVIDPARSRPPETREQTTVRGTSDWTRRGVEAIVPRDTVYLLFGITLTGPGQIWAANIELERV